LNFIISLSVLIVDGSAKSSEKQHFTTQKVLTKFIYRLM